MMDAPSQDQKSAKIYTLDTRPRRDEAYKPSELVQVTGHQSLSLNARRAVTILWHNAHLSGVEEGKDYVIEIDDLKTDLHKGYECVEQIVETLMRSVLVAKLPDGSTRRVQFLGGNDMDDPERHAGTLTYSFDKRLVQILKESEIWGKINIPVLMAFSSKYAVSLYENAAQFTGLTKKKFHEYTLDEFRDMLGVEEGRYPMFGALNKHVIKPAVSEINALAPFGLIVQPVKTGKRVTGVKLGWYAKTNEEQTAAWQEVQRSKVGRKARLTGTVEGVLPVTGSTNRNVRKIRSGSERPNSSQ